MSSHCSTLLLLWRTFESWGVENLMNRSHLSHFSQICLFLRSIHFLLILSSLHSSLIYYFSSFQPFYSSFTGKKWVEKWMGKTMILEWKVVEKNKIIQNFFLWIDLQSYKHYYYEYCNILIKVIISISKSKSNGEYRRTNDNSLMFRTIHCYFCLLFIQNKTNTLKYEYFYNWIIVTSLSIHKCHFSFVSRLESQLYKSKE